MDTIRGTQCNVQHNVIPYSRLEIENTFEAYKLTPKIDNMHPAPPNLQTAEFISIYCSSVVLDELDCT